MKLAAASVSHPVTLFRVDLVWRGQKNGLGDNHSFAGSSPSLYIDWGTGVPIVDVPPKQVIAMLI